MQLKLRMNPSVGHMIRRVLSKLPIVTCTLTIFLVLKGFRTIYCIATFMFPIALYLLFINFVVLEEGETREPH